jgi:hypothetical protein
MLLYFFCVGSLSARTKFSKYEIFWGIGHPFAAWKVKVLLPEAQKMLSSVKEDRLLDLNESGGKLDAFRHIYTMAFLSQKIKTKKLRKLGIAHEKGNKRLFFKGKQEFGERADSLACVMDLRNNELGFQINAENRCLKPEELKLLVLQQIRDGQAWYLKRNTKSQYVSCDGTPINMADYIGKWFLPKCLIRTNE